MSDLLRSHPLHETVQDFINGLRSIERDVITKPSVLRYLASTNLRVEALSPYIFWRDSLYTRNLIYRDELFEVMTICWLPGQKTAIHTHNGQLGWMITLQGEVLTHQFRYVRCSSPERQNVIGMDCIAGCNDVELERMDTISCPNDRQIVTVDKLQTIHQIENPDKARAGCISLHIYSKPFESCVAFDADDHRCFRRTLTYYSSDGKVNTQP